MKKNEFLEAKFEDEYITKNPIYIFLANNFFKEFQRQLDKHITENINNICDVGCGRGKLLKVIHQKYPTANLFACDILQIRLDEVKENCREMDIKLSIQDAQDLKMYKDNQFDLVVCCEVLEHLPNPEKGLSELARITAKYLIVSVPHEPIWRMLNLLRGKYISRLGNTPAHFNNWNIFSFSKFINKIETLKIIDSAFPFPWQLKLIEKLK